MPVEIADWNDLDNVRNDLTGDYVLVNDLNENTDGYAGIGDDFEPIGFVSGSRDGDPFSGVLDGDGFQISDLVIEENDSSEAGVAFISQVGNGGLVENLSVGGSVDSTIDDFFFGGLAASVALDGTGTIQNCVSHVDVTSIGGQVGGMVGRNDDTVTNSYATGSVEGNDAVGGLVGRVQSGTLTESYATGSVEGDEEAGGLVGWNNGTVTNSYATGSVEGDENRVGGLAGINQDTIQTSYAVGFVTGDTDVGALVGFNEFGDEIDSSYADEESTGQSLLIGDEEFGGVTNSETLTTAEMQGSEAETNMDGFDFADTWDSVLESDDDTTADGYPILIVLDRENQLEAQGILLLLSVETNPATDISKFSATLNGELVELDDGAEDTDVFFEFGESVTDSQTPIQTLTGPETFDELIDELSSNTTFEFRAVAESQDADGNKFTDKGDILTFDTEIVTLDGTISLDEVGVENADVVAHNLTQETFGGQTNTDADGNYAVDLSDADRLDTVAVAVDFDDGTERYGRVVTTVLE